MINRIDTKGETQTLEAWPTLPLEQLCQAEKINRSPPRAEQQLVQAGRSPSGFARPAL